MYTLIEIKNSEIHGKGVFAKVDIKKDTELVCDIITIPFNNLSDELKQYHYPYSRINIHTVSLCMGFGSFFNHSVTPNIRVYLMNKELLTKTFKTIKDINKGDELFLDYGYKLEL